MGRLQKASTVPSETIVATAMANMRETAASLRRAKDTASAEQAVAVLTHATENLRTLRHQLADLEEPSDAETALVKQHYESLVRAMQRIRRPSERILGRIQAREFAPEFAEHLARAVALYNQAMSEFGAQAIHLFV
jgi:hypothetical protein